jgi:serine/threonine-protein phosphatase 2B catalytic subunit
MAAPSPSTQTANAIRAINERANIPVPEIDFTVHELENGEIVRTDERVVKDVSDRSSKCYMTFESRGLVLLPWVQDLDTRY